MTKLAYDTRGTGPVLVLLHAFPFDRRMWSEELARAQSTCGASIAVDLRGFGESPLWGEPTIDELADDVVALLDELGVPMAIGVRPVDGRLRGAVDRGAAQGAAGVAGARRHARGGRLATWRSWRGEATMRQVRNDGTAAFLDGVPERMLSRHADRRPAPARARSVRRARRDDPGGDAGDGASARSHGDAGDDRLSDAARVRRRGHDLAGAGDALVGGADPRRGVRRDRGRRAPVEPRGARRASTKPWRASSPRTICSDRR